MRWNSLAQILPDEGQAVEFLVQGRTMPLEGNFDAGQFRSRWSVYTAERVSSWRAIATIGLLEAHNARGADESMLPDCPAIA